MFTHSANLPANVPETTRQPTILASVLAPRLGLDSAPGFKAYSPDMATYRISDAARLSGLPTSTLRYYERIGLVPPPERTESGYRAYEERALGRLAFIARARELGLRLDAIGGLADLWDAKRCGPVQERLRELITARIAETLEEAATLVARSSELSSFMTGLHSPTPEAPCSDNCGCEGASAPGSPPGVTLTMVSDPGTELACSLDRDEVVVRLAEWQALARQEKGRSAIEGGVRMTFASIDLRAVADLVAREQGCCSFLSFAIGVKPGETTLDVSGVSEAGPLREALGLKD
jgi:MerR family copper efflux transcriptional regulator